MPHTVQSLRPDSSAARPGSERASADNLKRHRRGGVRLAASTKHRRRQHACSSVRRGSMLPATFLEPLAAARMAQGS